ncbi:EF2563 family selenium-dependent molybdenum hydroxylase system protein [bacterium]|nr:EF2563 family selenium-dependent molybdenum hydroxylase system protein [bacterium]
MKQDSLVIVRGGGDLGSGVVLRLACAGYRVVVLEAERPTVVRRKVSFAQAVFDGRASVEGLSSISTTLPELETASIRPGLWNPDDGKGQPVPVVVDPEGRSLDILSPDAVVDARMAKRNLGTDIDDAPLTIGLGPGFEAGRDVDLVIETNRGHRLGRVIRAGSAEPDTGIPGAVLGVSEKRIVRSPASGTFRSTRRIGDLVKAGDKLGEAGGEAVLARTDGVIRGLISDGVELREGQKTGDIDPRGSVIDPATVSDKALAVAGGVLEALLSRGFLPGR